MPTRRVQKRIRRRHQTYTAAFEARWTRLLHRHRRRSPGTRRERGKILQAIAHTLADGGFFIGPEQLRPDHAAYLAAAWKRQDLARATLNSRLSCLKWVGSLFDVVLMPYARSYYLEKSRNA